MTPPRSVLRHWRALEAAERVRVEFDRRIGDLEELSAAVRAECHRLDGDGWQGAAFDAVLAVVEAAHHHNRILCDQAEGLRDAGVRALSDLHYTALALLDYVADAEADGCAVADDWTVTTESAVGAAWAEIIGEALAAVERAEQRGRQAILAVGQELRHLAEAFARELGLDDPPPPSHPDSPERSGGTGCPAPSGDRPGDAEPPGPVPRSGDVPRSDDPARPGDAARPGVETGGPPHAAEPAPGDRPAETGAPISPEPGTATDGGASSASTVPSAVDGGRTVPAAQSHPVQHVPMSQDDSGPVAGPGDAPHGPEPEPEIGVPAPVYAPPPAIPPGGVSAEQLVAIMPDLPLDRARQYLPALNAAMREGGITTPQRQAAFLAQLAHESCQFRYFQELGDDDYFHQYDPGQPNAAAGNTEPGDGPRYHGRGPIQLTGRANYRAAGQALGLDLEGDPEAAANPDVGFRIAQWYWASRDINALADAGDFAGVTRAVNGGYNGMESREAFYRRALEVLG